MVEISDFQEQLKEALLEYFRAVEFQQAADPGQKPPLRSHFEKLDSLSSRLPADADPRLRHYMSQKSYQKALNFLQGRANENADGDCKR